MREVSRLIAGARTHLQHLVAFADVDVTGHATDEVGPGDGHAEADIEIGVVIGTRQVGLGDETLARRHQKGALVGVIGDVLVGDEDLIASPALAQKVLILAAVLDHPFDEAVARIHGGIHVPVEGLRNLCKRRARHPARRHCDCSPHQE